MGEPIPGSSPSSRRSLRVLLRLVCAAMLAAIALTTIWNAAAVPIESPLTAGVAFVCLLHASFWTHTGALLAGAGLLAVLAGARWLGIMSLLVAATVLSPWARSHVRPLPHPRPGDIAVLSANLLYSRADLSALADEATRLGADVIVLQEVNDPIVPALLDRFGQTHPHHVIEPWPGAFGQAVFSTRPLRRTDEPLSGTGGLGQWALPCIDVIVELESGPLRIVNVHLASPVSMADVREQDRMARELADIASASQTPLIMAGDFNSPEIGVPMRRVMGAGLHSVHAARGRGLGATWPRVGVASHLLATRIDHILFSPALSCTDTGQGADNGSDHRPIWARFELSPSQR